MPKLLNNVLKAKFLVFLVVLYQVGVVNTKELTAQGLGEDSANLVTKNLDIFPAGKEGNAVYRDKVWLYSKPKAVIESALDITQLNTTVLLLKEGDKLSFAFLPDVSKRLFKKVSPIALTTDFGQKNLVVLAVDQKKLHSFLFNFKSISFNMAQNDKRQVAFYHLAKVEQDSETQTTVYQIRLHVFDADTQKVVTLPYILYARSYLLKLAWEGSSILVDFGDGNSNSYLVDY